MRKYRIVPTAPDTYKVQYKDRWIWRDAYKWFYEFQESLSFGSIEEAKAYIDKKIETDIAVKKHLAQPIIEYP